MLEATEYTSENNIQPAGRGGGGGGPAAGGAVKVLHHKQQAASRNGRQLLLVIGVLVLMFAAQEAFQWSHLMGLGSGLLAAEAAVGVQRLTVPELIVIDQFNQQLHQPGAGRQAEAGGGGGSGAAEPEAARLTNSDHNNLFDCLISYDPDKDSNLVVKWYHDDKPDAIYQWIPELHASPSIAPHYKPYIAPLRGAEEPPARLLAGTSSSPQGAGDAAPGHIPQAAGAKQLLRAAFKLLRPSKDFNGKYKCVATSSQNDDSKWKKMIVFTPPSNFRFNVSRLVAGSPPPAPHPPSQPVGSVAASGGWRRPSALQQPSNQMPIVYRLKGFEGPPAAPDYVNLSQQRSRFRSAAPHVPGATNLQQQQQQLAEPNNNSNNIKPLAATGRAALKLVCDIDQVFPLPEVTIYRLAKPDGSHPDKLANQEAQRQRNPITGLYSVQVTGTLDEDELTRIKYASSSPTEPIYFECLIALNDLQLSKYDNKRTILYKPEALVAGEDITGTSAGATGNSTNAHQSLLLLLPLLLPSVVAFLFQFHLTSRRLSICPMANR